jgi:hypothetical protein
MLRFCIICSLSLKTCYTYHKNVTSNILYFKNRKRRKTSDTSRKWTRFCRMYKKYHANSLLSILIHNWTAINLSNVGKGEEENRRSLRHLLLCPPPAFIPKHRTLRPVCANHVRVNVKQGDVSTTLVKWRDTNLLVVTEIVCVECLASMHFCYFPF